MRTEFTPRGVPFIPWILTVQLWSKGTYSYTQYTSALDNLQEGPQIKASTCTRKIRAFFADQCPSDTLCQGDQSAASYMGSPVRTNPDV